MACNLLDCARLLSNLSPLNFIAMNTRKLFALFAVLLGLAVSAAAQSAKVTEATVAKVSGAATVTLPDGSTAAVTLGMKIPQGASITTGADGEVLLQTHASTAATLKANTTVAIDELNTSSSGGKVTEEVTTLNLKNGNLVSALDPAKKSVNNYKVRTAKGVAAARGTTFSVTINGTNYSVTTTSGGVSFTNLATGASFTVGAGQTSSSSTGDTSVNIASLPEGSPEKAAAVAEMTNVLAAVAVATNVGIVPASELSAAVTAAVEAAPESARTITQTVTTIAPEQAQTVQNAVTNSNVSESVKTEARSGAETGVTNSGGTTSTSTSTTTTTSTGETVRETTTTTTATTTPTPIDVSVISRSN
jgi:hypothetical protein